MLPINILQQLQQTASLALQCAHAPDKMEHLSKSLTLLLGETNRFQSAYATLQESYKTVNEELLAKNALLNHIVRHGTEGILFVSLQGKIVLCNTVAEQIVNTLAKDILGKKFWEVFPDDRFGFSMREALQLGISHSRLYAKDLEIGSSFLYECPTNGKGILLVLKDLTETKKWQLIANRNDRMKELGEGVAVAAHEMRNALGGIRGFSMLLQRDLQENPHLAELASYVLDGIKSLERIVQSILHYGKQIDIQIESVEMGAFLRNFSKWLKNDPLFPSNVKLALHVPHTPMMVPIDKNALQSALLNLAHNGFHAMHAGGSLTLSLMQMGSKCEISVTDTGIGMDEEHMSHLFSPFFTTKSTGHGFGLTEVKKIIQAHFGKIEVRSQKNRGTTFNITLPLRRFND